MMISEMYNDFYVLNNNSKGSVDNHGKKARFQSISSFMGVYS